MRGKRIAKYDDIDYNLTRDMNNQNMQNVYQQQMNYGNINPRTFDSKYKTSVINQNIFHSGHGMYKICPVVNSIRIPYKNSYNPGTINNICKVMVHHKHAIDVADSLSDHGLDSIAAVNKQIPAVMYPMGTAFIGTNIESREGIYDENIVLRTNYPYVIKKQSDIFNVKDDHKMVVYSNPITVIRDQNYLPLSYEKLFKFVVLTVRYNREKDLLSEEKNEKDKKPIATLTSSDMLNFQMCIENVFQGAICGFHNVILLSIFGRDFGIPIEDQILIYNLCIMKFGHMFKAILLCVPPYEDKGLFEFFNKEIIKPQDLTKDIDMNYMTKNMIHRLNNESDEEQSKENLTKKMASMNEEDRMKMLRQLIKTNKKDKNNKQTKRKQK